MFTSLVSRKNTKEEAGRKTVAVKLRTIHYTMYVFVSIF